MPVHTCVVECARNGEDIIYATGASFLEGATLVEFMYFLFTRMPGESYRRRLRSLLLCLCGVFRALIN